MYARCRICAKTWNISISQKIPKQGYICPWCENSMRRVIERPDYRSQTKIHVLKVWKQDQVKERPASVQVDLLRTDQNGTTTVVDSQILKKENQWSYTWENLSSQVSWSVVETEVPSGYTVSTSREGNTVVLTNTKTADSEDKSESTDKTGTSGENGGNSSQKLPQTGQLWWPVPLLMLAGVICLLVGKQLRKSMEEKK